MSHKKKYIIVESSSDAEDSEEIADRVDSEEIADLLRRPNSYFFQLTVSAFFLHLSDLYYLISLYIIQCSPPIITLLSRYFHAIISASCC